jgi:hypothetical protein
MPGRAHMLGCAHTLGRADRARAHTHRTHLRRAAGGGGPCRRGPGERSRHSAVAARAGERSVGRRKYGDSAGSAREISAREHRSVGDEKMLLSGTLWVHVHASAPSWAGARRGPLLRDHHTGRRRGKRPVSTRSDVQTRRTKGATDAEHSAPAKTTPEDHAMLRSPNAVLGLLPAGPKAVGSQASAEMCRRSRGPAHQASRKRVRRA